MFGNIEQVIDDFSSVKDFTDGGKCSGCGNCCTNYLPMSEKEIRIIKSYIAKHSIKEQVHGILLAGPSFDLTCPFLRNTGNQRCTIYPVRPAICKQFICSTKQPIVPMDLSIKPILVRETFYGSSSIKMNEGVKC